MSTAAVVAAAVFVIAADSAGQGISPEQARRMLAADKLHADEAFRQVYWIGETAPIFLSIAREIQDPGTVDEGYSWLRYACSADSPEDISVGAWYLRLELILFDESGKAIYASENDDSTYEGSSLSRAGGICGFSLVQTAIRDDVIDHGFIEFPETLNPASAVIYVSPDETSDVEILTNTYTSVHRPPPAAVTP